MPFFLQFYNCQPFVWLIGALVVGSVFGLIKLIYRGGESK